MLEITLWDGVLCDTGRAGLGLRARINPGLGKVTGDTGLPTLSSAWAGRTLDCVALGPSDCTGDGGTGADIDEAEALVIGPLRFARATIGAAGLVLLEPEVTENVRVLEFSGIETGAGGGDPGLRSGTPALP